ncbi:hypothetical protein FB451DRAFT_1384948 [Mycena latifolia]|nr:hypothetical protein FB451DRAFT_1384948 [Mycena latifolia]
MVARHRLVKSMKLDAQLEDEDVLSDGGEDYISPEHQALLNDGLDRIRDIIGGPDVSGLSDDQIKDVLWDCHFDIEETTQWALEEQEKMHLAQERKAPSHVMKDLPPLPPPSEQRELGYGEYSPPAIVPRPIIEGGPGEPEERSHVPLIVRAQQQYQAAELESETTGAPVRRNLSTITERTERTEIWPTQQQLMSLNLPRAPSSVTTSYGQTVDQVQVDTTISSLNPDLIPVSPSGSAVHRLSFYEPAPSMPPSEADSYENYTSPRAPSEPVPPLDTIPDIPDLNSKSSRHVASKVASQPAKKSKLAMLATSRATTSSTRSESSRSSGTDVLGSVKTYPDLRPSSQSLRSPSSVASTEKPSSTSSHVRRAIQTALELEAGDRGPPLQTGTPDSPRTPTLTLNRPSAPTPSKVPEMPSSSGSPPARPPSKLALLAQANKAARIAKPKTPASSGPPRLPEEHTEYLTPISNGPTVTTAITTSYQSFYSLTDPERPPMGSTPFVVPLPTPTYVSSTPDAKKSKLAMKIKKAQEKQQSQPVAPAAPPPSVPVMFLPKPTRTRAPPSAFASLLVDDALPFEVHDTEARQVAKQKKLKEKQLEEQSRHRSRRNPPARVPDFFAPSGFAFDGPSPDDIVLNARRDTSLAQTRKAPLASVTKPFILKT